MREALAEMPEYSRRIPAGIVRATIDTNTGLLAQPGQANTMDEYFIAENTPTRSSAEVVAESQELLLDVF